MAEMGKSKKLTVHSAQSSAKGMKICPQIMQITQIT